MVWLLGAAGGPAALVAMECGWIVTEVGRQPWVVYRLLTTSQAATTNTGIIATLTAVIVLYGVVGSPPSSYCGCSLDAGAGKGEQRGVGPIRAASMAPRTAADEPA